MEQIPLLAQKRTVLGRKVKNLRKDGLIPAHVFGHKVSTIHVQVKTSDFAKVFEKAGETGIVDLAIDSQKKPVLIRNVQTHPVTDEPLHIDFYQVNLAEKVKVDVPLEIIGESPAVEKKIGLLLTPVSEVEVEALPADLPAKIDVSKLENVGDEIKIKDLKVDRAKVAILADEELVVAQIGELVTKEMEAVEAEIEAEKVEAVAEAVPEAVAEEGEEARAEAAEVEEKAEEAKPQADQTQESTKVQEQPEKDQEEKK